MANVASERPSSSHSEKPVIPETIPDVIEERRKDSEGRIVSNRYLRGKLLGKVRPTNGPIRRIVVGKHQC